MILLAPQRTSAPWFLCLQRLLSGPPKELPCRRDALSQAGGAIIDYPEIGQRLWAWPLNAISPISCAPYAQKKINHKATLESFETNPCLLCEVHGGSAQISTVICALQKTFPGPPPDETTAVALAV